MAPADADLCGCCDPRGAGAACAPCQVTLTAIDRLTQESLDRFRRRVAEDRAHAASFERTVDRLLALHREAHEELGCAG